MAKCAGYSRATRIHVRTFPSPSEEDSDTDLQLVWKPHFKHTVPYCQASSLHVLIEYIRSVYKT